MVVSLASYIRSGRTVAAAGKCAFFITVRVRVYVFARGRNGFRKPVHDNDAYGLLRTVYTRVEREKKSTEKIRSFYFLNPFVLLRDSRRRARKLFYRFFYSAFPGFSRNRPRPGFTGANATRQATYDSLRSIQSGYEFSDQSKIDAIPSAKQTTHSEFLVKLYGRYRYALPYAFTEYLE